MTETNITNKTSLFRKRKHDKISFDNQYFRENINQNASWFQSMEPVIYAKKNSRKLFEIEDTILLNIEKRDFNKVLLSKLKPELDSKKDSIKKIFLKTSDGSLCVGLNVILLDSLLKVIFKNISMLVLKNINVNFSIVAVGGYGRGELAPYSDLDLLFLLPDNLNQNDTYNVEKAIQLILYLLWDLGFTVGHSTRSVKDCIEKSGLDFTILTSLLEKRLIIGSEEVFNVLPGSGFDLEELTAVA